MKKILSLLLVGIILCLVSCNFNFQFTEEQDSKIKLPEEMPEDFSFSIVWNTDGVSSYDSKTGKLVKDKWASKPNDYTTSYHMSEDELKTVYKLIYDLNIDDYPDEIPYGTFVDADPSSKLVLSVSTKDYNKTVKADSVGAFEAFNEQGEKYLIVIRAIIDILYETEEWKTLPDYESYFN